MYKRKQNVTLIVLSCHYFLVSCFNIEVYFDVFRIDGSWPESSVTVKDGSLEFLTMDASLNGLYQCEASNEYGSKYGRLYVHINAGELWFTVFNFYFHLEFPFVLCLT